MEVIELADLRKAFIPSKYRYVNPHAEAMRLRTLWTWAQRPSRSRDVQRVNQILAEAKKFVDVQQFSDALTRISKALLINPRNHALYALRGDIFSYRDKWDAAVRNYEEARRMIQFSKEAETEKSSLYTKNLIDAYRKRGLRKYEEGRLLYASSDYEQILVLRPYGVIVTDIQDYLLKTLRILDKYEAFRCEWKRFMNDADPSRASQLLTQHAEYKIFRNEMALARHMLLEAIDLDDDNITARELLQVVYDTGHHLVAFSIIWAVYGCYDKSLATIEKGRDCDPYNPGYTLLKAIVLRLSGRLLEAAKWLESVDNGFHKLLVSSRDKKHHGSIMGSLTIEQTRIQLIEQWHLIRYDIAVQFMMEERYEIAAQILESSKLREQYTEIDLLIGDCMLKLGDPTSKALRVYLKSLKNGATKDGEAKAQKKVGTLKRVTDILNHACNEAVEEKRAKDAIDIAEEVMRMLDNEYRVNATELGHNRGEALICKARADYQMAKVSKNVVYRRAAAEGLTFTRGADDCGLYRTIFNDRMIEQVVDGFGTGRKFPASLKLLIQYS